MSPNLKKALAAVPKPPATKKKNSNSIIDVVPQIDLNFNISRRLIYLEQEIDAFSVGLLQERAHAIMDLSGDHKSPITLQISSFGGDIYGMYAMIDSMANLGVKVNTRACGPCMSAAAIILAAGTGERSASPHSKIMVHRISVDSMGGNSAEIKTTAKHMDEIQDEMFELLEKYTKKPIAFWIKNAHTDFYMTPEQAIEYGLIDKIWK